MKKLTLTEQQKKVLKATAITVGGAILIGTGIKIVSRTELGARIKDAAIAALLKSKCAVNGREFQMHTYVSNRSCPNKEVALKAIEEAYELWKSIILEETAAG